MSVPDEIRGYGPVKEENAKKQLSYAKSFLEKFENPEFASGLEFLDYSAGQLTFRDLFTGIILNDDVPNMLGAAQMNSLANRGNKALFPVVDGSPISASPPRIWLPNQCTSRGKRAHRLR